MKSISAILLITLSYGKNIAGVFTGTPNAAPTVDGVEFWDCGAYTEEWGEDGEGGTGSFDDPFFGVVVSDDHDDGEPIVCAKFYGIPTLKDPNTFLYFSLKGREPKTEHTNMLIGEKACRSVGVEDCEGTFAYRSLWLSTVFTYINSNPPIFGDNEATVCSGFAWDTGNEGTRDKPKSAIILNSEESAEELFCGRIYQNEDGEYFAIKAHGVDDEIPGTYSIILDRESCDASCAVPCEPFLGCKDPPYLRVAGQMEPDATTPGPETTEPEDTTMEPEDTTMEPKDTTMEPKDTTMEPKDTTMEPKDTTLELESTTKEASAMFAPNPLPCCSFP
eukprot:GHVP01036076.1.p1 GENE.GHVP01036076.1~~GHVP01036076.1.p1  ORF type:complete len:333 (-),score=67.61 GHVP01036076.1:1235-2233(-)